RRWITTTTDLLVRVTVSSLSGSLVWMGGRERASLFLSLRTDHKKASAMSQVATPISIALPKSNIARFDFFHTPAQALSPVVSQPRHLQPEQRYALRELNLLNTRS